MDEMGATILRPLTGYRPNAWCEINLAPRHGRDLVAPLTRQDKQLNERAEWIA